MFAIPTAVSGWGFEAHKFIAGRMIELLPAEWKPLFEQRRADIVEHSIDPDLWRNVGWTDEPPNHFLDLDNEAFGPYRTVIFDALLASTRASTNVFESDQKAVAGREFYDDAYFEAFATGTLPVLERRVNDAITSVASIIIGAWEQAGKPALPADGPRTPRRLPRPKQ